MIERVYFDYNATSPLRSEVRDLTSLLPLIPYNSSSIHYYGRQAKKLLSEARDKVSNLLKASEKYQVVFTASGTEANNLAIKGIENKVFIVSPTEHPSVLNSLKELNHQTLKIQSDGVVNLEQYERLLSQYEGRAIVSIMMANNETGVIQDIKLLAEIAHKYGCLFHTDAVQALGKSFVSVEDLNIDLMTISSHKIGGPFGAAALIYKKSIDLKPLIDGGGQEQSRRAGTENLASILGFCKALELSLNEIEAFCNHTSSLRDFLQKNLKLISKDIIVFGESNLRLPNTICFTMPGVDSYTQVINFDLEGFAVSAGSACSSGKVKVSHVISNMGYADDVASSAIRVSLGLNNNLDQVTIFLEKWQEIYNRLSIRAAVA